MPIYSTVYGFTQTAGRKFPPFFSPRAAGTPTADDLSDSPEGTTRMANSPRSAATWSAVLALGLVLPVWADATPKHKPPAAVEERISLVDKYLGNEIASLEALYK